MRFSIAPPSTRQIAKIPASPTEWVDPDVGPAAFVPPLFIGCRSGQGVGTLELPYPTGTSVGDLAVVIGIAGYGGWVTGGSPSPFLTPLTPYAGTPFPYARYLVPGSDTWASSWGIYPSEESGVRRLSGGSGNRQFSAGKVVTSPSDTFSITLSTNAPIAAFLLTFSDASYSAPRGFQHDTLGWERSGFGATPPYAVPRTDFATEDDLYVDNRGDGDPYRLPFYLLYLFAPLLTRSSEDSSYPLTVIPPADYASLTFEPDTTFDYEAATLLASQGGAVLYMVAASDGQEDSSTGGPYFSTYAVRADGTVNTSTAFSGRNYSYLSFDPIYWNYTHQTFRFYSMTAGVLSSPTTGGGGAIARATSRHLSGNRRFQRFVQRAT